VPTIALIALFGTGFVATAGRHLSRGYPTVAGIALVLVVSVLAIALLVGAHPGIAERAGRRVACWAQHVRSGIDPEAQRPIFHPHRRGGDFQGRLWSGAGAQ